MKYIIIDWCRDILIFHLTSSKSDNELHSASISDLSWTIRDTTPGTTTSSSANVSCPSQVSRKHQATFSDHLPVSPGLVKVTNDQLFNTTSQVTRSLRNQPPTSSDVAILSTGIVKSTKTTLYHDCNTIFKNFLYVCHILKS